MDCSFFEHLPFSNSILKQMLNCLIQNRVDFSDDVMNGIIKSMAFGFVASWIALFEGYDTVPTSEGVSRATTRTVVHTSLAVLGLDFVLTALMFD